MSDHAAEPAYRTISDVAALVGVPHHVLRFWESKFPAIAPLKRGGNRRYYRPADVAVIQRIARLLHVEGYTIKGAQNLLGSYEAVVAAPGPTIAASSDAAPGIWLAEVRATLVAGLAAARAI